MATTSSSRHVLIVGGGYAGVLAANRARNRLRPHDRVTLLSDGPALVHRIRLHERLAGRTVPDLPLASLVGPGVAVVQDRALRVDAARKTVYTATGEALTADALLLCLGSRLSAPIAGVVPYGDGLASAARADRAAEIVAALPEGAPVVVVGGGLTAVETVAELAEAHPRLEVTLLAGELAPSLSARGRAYVRDTLDALGVRVAEGVRAAAITDDAVHGADGRVWPARLAVWAGGFDTAGPSVAHDLAADVRGRLRVGRDLGAVGHAGVFVAGDAAAPPPGMDYLRMGCVSAMPMGAQAADNAVRWLDGRETEAMRFGFVVQCVSLGRRRGLVQSVTPDDRATPRVVTGRAGALVKEGICRLVVGMIRAERWVDGAYQWPRSMPAAEALA